MYNYLLKKHYNKNEALTWVVRIGERLQSSSICDNNESFKELWVASGNSRNEYSIFLKKTRKFKLKIQSSKTMGDKVK